MCHLALCCHRGHPVPSSSSFLWFFFAGDGVDSARPSAGNNQTTQTVPAQRPVLFAPLFATGSLGTQEGDVGGVGYIAEVWVLGPMAEVN